MYVLIVTRSELTCGQPPKVSHVAIQYTGLGYMDKATYTCASGYQSDGQQHVLVCTKTATWEGDKITCTGNTFLTQVVEHTMIHIIKLTNHILVMLYIIETYNAECACVFPC